MMDVAGSLYIIKLIGAPGKRGPPAAGRITSVARIVDYDTVLQTLLAQGLKSLYYNSGSFGFPDAVTTHTLGWIGPPDPTIRADAIPFTRQIPAPHVQNLTARARRVWQAHVPGVVWAMP